MRDRDDVRREAAVHKHPTGYVSGYVPDAETILAARGPSAKAPEPPREPEPVLVRFRGYSTGRPSQWMVRVGNRLRPF